MPKNWVGDTAPFTAALGDLSESYRDVLHEQVNSVTESQQNVTSRLRSFEKTIATTSQGICKQISKLDYQGLAEDTMAIESLLTSTHSLIEQCIDQIIASQHQIPNKHDYPNIYEYAIQRSKPEIQKQARPQTSLQRINTLENKYVHK